MLDFSRNLRTDESSALLVRRSLPFGLIVLWGVMVVVWTLIVHAPASWLLARMSVGTGLTFVSAQGSVWDGRVVWKMADDALPLSWRCGFDLRGLDCLLHVGEDRDEIRISAWPQHWHIESTRLNIPAWVPMNFVPSTLFSSALQVRSLRAWGDLGDPARWNVSGSLHYGGGMTRIGLQGQPYSVRMPEVVLRTIKASNPLQWELDEMDGSILARFIILPGHRYRVDLAQRLLALSPLYQGKAWNPDRIDVSVQDQW